MPLAIGKLLHDLGAEALRGARALQTHVRLHQPRDGTEADIFVALALVRTFPIAAKAPLSQVLGAYHCRDIYRKRHEATEAKPIYYPGLTLAFLRCELFLRPAATVEELRE